MRIYTTSKIGVKCGKFVVLWWGMILSYFAQEIQSQRTTSLALHKEKYNPEDLQCLYQEIKKVCMPCGRKK